MISREDCIALCGLDGDQIDAISEHEHLPEVAAAALARYLMQETGGPQRVRDMIADDIRSALDRGDVVHAAELLSALQHFLQQHPEAGSPPAL